jgi:phage-related minor tail protein
LYIYILLKERERARESERERERERERESESERERERENLKKQLVQVKGSWPTESLNGELLHKKDRTVISKKC